MQIRTLTSYMYEADVSSVSPSSERMGLFVELTDPYLVVVAKIQVTAPIVINMPTRELLAGETNSFV